VPFRKRVIEYKDAGHTFKDVQEAFGVDSKQCYSREKQLEQTGSLKYNSRGLLPALKGGGGSFK
jgi:hypothetical protein